MVPDFSGYVTRYGVRCTDGRTILAHAFKDSDKQTIPLVWQHGHKEPTNVLGRLELEHKDDGVYARGFFNDTPTGQHVKQSVIHGDLDKLSIYANQLVQKGSNVIHGAIREGSVVISNANPGAFIDFVNLVHGDESEDEAIIYFDEPIELAHADSSDSSADDAGDEGPDDDNDADDLPADATVEQVIASLTDQQKNVVYALVGAAMQQSGTGEDDGDTSLSHDTDKDKEGQPPVKRNVFDQTDTETHPNGNQAAGWKSLSHSDIQGIFEDARKGNGSLKDACERFIERSGATLQHGVNSIDTLFPYDQAVTDTPEFITRRVEWVAGVLNATRKTPFSRIRSWTADLTLEEARAKGYVKGSVKKEEYFNVAKRITTPQTIYKKQKLDRDDIIDITEFDIVMWLQTEMRIMLDEELARAILIGDGREVDDPDKIDPTHVRPIVGDDELYVSTLEVATSAITTTADSIVDAVVTGMRLYRGSGNPVMYTTRPYLAKMLLAKDTLGRRLYPTVAELSAALGVNGVIPCEALESASGLIGIIVNLIDYTVGADKGGQVSMFDFFDIDFNQQKYLMECRMSGAMTKYKGALVVREFTGAGGTLADPTAPTFAEDTGVVTIPTLTNVSYVSVATDGTESSALTAGAQAALNPGASVHIRAKAASTYAFVDDADSDWTFTRDSD